ncbi:MAG: hypothetical protein LKI59_05610 [Bacteroidales bacterium]|jgi:hypothetical protein|nr:hypothetical protein [Bacteroidales bacterium]
MMKKIFIYFLLSASCLLPMSCQNSHKIKLVQPADNVVYNRFGKVQGYSIDMSKKKVINYLTPGGLNDDLYHTDKGKIDRIIKDNPDWDFIFYIGCQEADTSKVMEILTQYGCNFPVILDIDKNFLKTNLDSQYSEIGFICDSKNEIMDVCVIGTKQSSFDTDFRKVKRILQ